MGQKRVSTNSSRAAVLLTAAAVLSAGLFGLALNRLLFEALFPVAFVLGRPLPALAFGLAGALLGWLAWRRLRAGHGAWSSTLPFLPWLVNARYLLRPAVDPVAGPLLFAGSVWLVLVLLTRLLARPARWRPLASLWLLAFWPPSTC
jgi:hypothetical protein